MSFYIRGFKAMLPISIGVIPFGAVMGSVTAEAKLTFTQSFFMNIFVFAGAAQLAAVDLMTKNAALTVVVMTGLVINLRFLLYSAALSPVVHDSSPLIKTISAYFLTDQSYATMTSHQGLFKNNKQAIEFYLGSCICMGLGWHLSVTLGYIFGNFAPPSLSIDFAVPLSFISLLIPTIKNKKYILVAIFSSIVSLLFNAIPYRMGLILTALLGIAFAILLTRKKKTAQ
ncbi:MAG: AzlC family ABC transporter permease [Xanthomonadaceae bacterium]|nr:AzlC family ABC transporter permease [Xanthomonadaceae bacterium]